MNHLRSIINVLCVVYLNNISMEARSICQHHKNWIRQACRLKAETPNPIWNSMPMNLVNYRPKWWFLRIPEQLDTVSLVKLIPMMYSYFIMVTTSRRHLLYSFDVVLSSAIPWYLRFIVKNLKWLSLKFLHLFWNKNT